MLDGLLKFDTSWKAAPFFAFLAACCGLASAAPQGVLPYSLRFASWPWSLG